ncbi:MAG: sodium:solute symporter, partial [Acetobacteraceae bacterium]|nr:sodium:solute symporter [Acetobacteraceae bacterium]
RVIRRNAAILPAYSLLLGLLALLGYMAIAAAVQQTPAFAGGFKRYGNNFAIPAVMLASFPSWFVGVAFAAIAIGALVPAAIMSIATANLFTRNIWKEFVRPGCSEAEESQVAKLVSLIVKAGALVFIFALDLPYALQLQLLGGVWMIQVLPAVILGLYTRILNGWALLIGWLVGIGLGSYMAWTSSFKVAIYPISFFGLQVPCFIALSSLVANILVSVLLSLALNPFLADRETDLTMLEDYA